jgi:hypothetical protein
MKADRLLYVNGFSVEVIRKTDREGGRNFRRRILNVLVGVLDFLMSLAVTARLSQLAHILALAAVLDFA